MSFLFILNIYSEVYEQLVSQGAIEIKQEVPPPTVPMDYNWARVSRPKLDQNINMIKENIYPKIPQEHLWKFIDWWNMIMSLTL